MRSNCGTEPPAARALHSRPVAPNLSPNRNRRCRRPVSPTSRAPVSFPKRRSACTAKTGWNTPRTRQAGVAPGPEAITGNDITIIREVGSRGRRWEQGWVWEAAREGWATEEGDTRAAASETSRTSPACFTVLARLAAHSLRASSTDYTLASAAQHRHLFQMVRFALEARFASGPTCRVISRTVADALGPPAHAL